MNRFFAGASLLLAVSSVAPPRAEAQESWFSPSLGRETMIHLKSTSPSEKSTCPSGKVAIGMTIRSGALLDALELECASVDAAGRHVGATEAIGYIGGSGGSARTVRCPAGRVIHGFKGRSGELIDQISFTCRAWKPGTGSHGGWTWRGPYGGSGGQSFGPVTCPGNGAVTSLWGVSIGAYVADLRFECRTNA